MINLVVCDDSIMLQVLARLGYTVVNGIVVDASGTAVDTLAMLDKVMRQERAVTFTEAELTLIRTALKGLERDKTYGRYARSVIRKIDGSAYDENKVLGN
jgi:hypothetical protein